MRSAVQDTDFGRLIPQLADPITVSVGVATFPVDCLTEDDLFRKANEALQRAKRLGTNRTCFAREDGSSPGDEA